MIKKYRKIAMIKAEQFDCSTEMIVKYNIHANPEGHYFGGVPLYEYELPIYEYELPTKEGNMEVHMGDYIATGFEGEHWVIKRSIFEKTYEPVQNITDCPYCHPDSNLLDSYGISAWHNDELNLEEIDNQTGKIDNKGDDMWSDLAFNPMLKYLRVWGDGMDPLTVHIKYCPFCGRKL